eukprot:6998059-Prymnesium_polylepis.1
MPPMIAGGVGQDLFRVFARRHHRDQGGRAHDAHAHVGGARPAVCVVRQPPVHTRFLRFTPTGSHPLPRLGLALLSELVASVGCWPQVCPRRLHRVTLPNMACTLPNMARTLPNMARTLPNMVRQRLLHRIAVGDRLVPAALRPEPAARRQDIPSLVRRAIHFPNRACPPHVPHRGAPPSDAHLLHMRTSFTCAPCLIWAQLRGPRHEVHHLRGHRLHDHLQLLRRRRRRQRGRSHP